MDGQNLIEQQAQYTNVFTELEQALMAAKAEIERLREDNEHIRQNSVSHEVYKMRLAENEELERRLNYRLF